MVRNYLKGHPCKLTYGPTILFGRIVGPNVAGIWSCSPDGVIFSSPMVSTPHGTIFETQQYNLTDLEENDWQKLLLLELSIEGVLYGGNITLTEMANGNEV